MRVAVDFKAISSEAAMRGMGRYTQQQIRAVLAHDPNIELFLLMHGPVPKENALFDWTEFPNVHSIPISVDGHDLDYRHSPSFETIVAYSHRIQQLLNRLKIDVFHNTVPFMHPYYSAITVCPVVTTFYDAIPLIFPADYFGPPYGSPVLRQHYLRSLENVAKSERVIAISESAANDLSLYTGFPAGKIHVAYPLIESVFRPIDDGRMPGPDHGNVSSFNTVDFGKLPKRFALSVTGIHHAKNVSLLVDGFLKAACEIGENWGLVVVLPSEWAKTEFDRRFGSTPRIVTVADVSEQELALLYNRAYVVVQPSMYEGFGYPVAEAMSCGAAVIATNTSSIPEIAGHAALLVSPHDVNMLAAAIIRLARDRDLRATLKLRALERSVLFRDPRALGSGTVNAYRSAAGVCGQNMLGQPGVQSARRPRVAVWSSMPPKDCGVADYTSELALELALTHDVDVYVDGKYDPTPSKSLHVNYRHPEDYGIDGKPDRNIYQLGARKGYQDYMYPYIRRHRGTMVIHDLTMAQAFYYIAKWSGLINEFEDEVVWQEGLGVLDAYERLGANSMTPPHSLLQDFFKRHKMLQWLINHSDHMIVHTAPLRERLLESYPSANVQVVHMGVADWIPAQRHLPRAAMRHAFGLRGNGICVGCFGIVDRIKRIGVVIESFVELCKRYPSSVLMLVGSCYDSAYKREMNSQIAQSGVAGRVVVLDYVPPDALHALMALPDVVVNLRSPDQLGLSAVLLRALAAAKPVIISAIAEWRIFPGGTCLSVTADDHEVEQLTGHLVDLASSSAERERCGQAARRWFLENGTLSKMADDYMAPSRCEAAVAVPTPQ